MLNKMAAFRKGKIFWPQFQQVRCRSKVNIQHPRPRHDARRLFEAITKPVILPEAIPPMEKCAKLRAQAIEEMNQVNLYEEFLLKQCKKLIQNHRMIAVCQALPMPTSTKIAIRNKLISKGMRLAFFNNSLMRRAVADSPLVNLLPFLIGNNYYVVSTEPQVKELTQVLRKIPQLILLGGLVDNYILTRESLMECSKLPSLDIMRGELLTILSSSASKTHSLLGSQQQMLSRNLQQYVQQSQEGSSSTAALPSSPAEEKS